jgi:xylose isomerase
MGKYIYSVGVWNDNPGASRFGEASRSAKTVIERIRMFAKLGVGAIEAHDNEVKPEMVPEVKKVLKEEGLIMGMYTPNFFWDAQYANGALASHDAKVRESAIERFKKAVDTAHLLEAWVMVYWNGQEGSDVALGKCSVDALGYLQDAFNQVLEYDFDNYGKKALRLAIEPKPNEPRCHMLLPTVGDALAFAMSLDPKHNHRVGVNPETAHSVMVGLNYVKDLESAMFYERLFHIHLNDQESPKYDQDLAFASVNLKRGLETIAVLLRHEYKGLVGFDLNPLRTDDENSRSQVINASIRNFERLLAIAREINWGKVEILRAEGNFSDLDEYLDDLIME